MDFNNLWFQLLIVFVVFGILKLGMGLLNKVYTKENKNPYGPKRTIHFTIFSARAAEDTFVLALLTSMSGVYKFIPVHYPGEDLSNKIFYFAFGYYILNMLIRYLVNYFNVKRGKPDIIANYWMPNEQK